MGADDMLLDTPPTPPGTCGNCGAPIPPPTTFCSQGCALAFWRGKAIPATPRELAELTALPWTDAD